MSKENQNTAGENAALSQEGHNMALAMSLLGSLPEGTQKMLMKTDEVAGLNAILEKGASAGERGSGANEKSGDDQGDKGQGDQAGEESKGGEQKQNGSIFFKAEESSSKDIKIPDFKTNADMQEFVKKQFQVNDVNAFFSQATDWKKSSEELDKLRAEKQLLEDFLSGAPEPLYRAIELFHSGKDWKTALKMVDSKVDFTKGYADNNEKDILNHYFPGEFTEADIAAKADNEGVKRAISLARTSFDKDSRSATEQKRDVGARAQQRSKEIQASIQKSIGVMQKAYPALGETERKRVEKMMLSGDYSGLFLTNDGVFTDEAAKNLAMAMYGEQEIKRQVSKKTTEQVNKGTEELLRRGADTVRNRGSNRQEGADEQSLRADKGTMNMLQGLIKKNNTYSAQAV